MENLSLLAPQEVPEFGTFYLYQDQLNGEEPPPYPFNPCPLCPVYSLGIEGQFLVDDRGVNWPEPEPGPVYEPLSYEPGALWLEITSLSGGIVDMILHGTEAGTNFTIESRPTLSEGWAREIIIVGATNQDWTPVSVAIGSRNISLFFRARVGEIPEYSGLWLEIPADGLAVPDQMTVILHNTLQDEAYDLLTKQSLADPTWTLEPPAVWGMEGDTPATLVLNGRTNLFVSARAATLDSDGDGLPDWWEMEHGLDPSNPDTGSTGTPDGYKDEDGDGYINLEEYLLVQDPHAADPPRPNIAITATDASAGEPNISGAFTLTRDGVTTKALDVYFTAKGLARAGNDYQSLGGGTNFAVGQSSITLQVVPLDDDEYEGTEDVTVGLLPAMDYVTAEIDSATVTISDNEAQPVKVSASSDAVVEGSGTNGVFRFYREGDTRLPLTVNFALTGTATNGVIYQTLPTSVTFAMDAGITNLPVIAINNTNYSGTTTGTVTLLPNTAYWIETNAGGAELTFVDDDLPTVDITASDADAREAGLNPGRFLVSRTGTTQEALTVYYRVSGTAEMGSSTNYTGDYQSLSNTVAIPAGQGNAVIDIVPVQDIVAEPLEQVILTLAGSENYRIGASNSASVNIDDDEPLSYVWTTNRPSVYGAGRYMPGVIQITRRGSALAASSLPWSVTYSDGTPVYSGSYQVTGDFLNGNLYFAPNRSTATVKLLYTSATPTNVQFRFAGQIAGMPCWGADRLVRILVERDYAIEGSVFGKGRLWLYRAAAGGPPLTVGLRFDGAATPGVDFPTTNVQSVTFSQGSASQLVEVFANSDGVTEGWESLVVRLDTADPNFTTYNLDVPQDSPLQETYGVIWLREESTSGPRPDVDTDQDLLNDGFETARGLNPLVPDDHLADTDKDGLSTLEEQASGTDSNLADSDGDGVNDFFETSRGSNPTDSLDYALNADHTAKIACVVGDDSGSVSERWQLTVGSFAANNAVPGQVISRDINLKEGASYTVTLRHLSSILVPPDLDYHIELRSGDAAPPSFLVRDPQQLLGLHFDPGDGPQYATKTATVLVPKLELTWTNKGDNLLLDMNTNGFNGEVRGNRIFVGAKTPTETNPRNTVMLKINTTPPLVGSNVWLRSFDVDDTTDDKGLDNAGIIDSNGRSGDDNFNDYLSTPKAGLFVANGQSSYSTTLNASGEALVEFRVGMQPGNNYRIAATVIPTNNLGTLQSANAVGNGYVSAYTDKVRTGFNGVVSPLLTVWRRLHLEVDSMSAVPTSGPEANFCTDRVFLVETNKPKAGQTRVWLRYANPPWPPNRFENGTLTIAGVPGSFSILASGFEVFLLGPQNYVIVPNLLPASAVGHNCAIRDDDDRLKTELQLPSLPMDGFSDLIINGKPLVFSTRKMRGVAAVYAPACIQVLDANQLGWNARRTIPFYLNKDVFDVGLSGVFDDAKDLNDTEVFWAHTVTVGYQPTHDADGDNNDESFDLGITPETPLSWKAMGYSAIYDETIRDYAYEGITNAPAYYSAPNYKTLEVEYYGWLLGTIAHEVGHAPGSHYRDSDHAESGLMRTGGARITYDFPMQAIARFRKSTSWSNGIP